MNIPRTWHNILTMIQRVAPEAILAGGALRDLDNGRPISDLDIFISTNGLDDFRVKAAEIALSLECYSERPTRSGYKGVTQAHYVCNTRMMVDNLEVNLIGVLCMDVIERFDFGICKISYDGKEVRTLLDYDRDKANHTISYDTKNPYVFHKTSMKRVGKIQEKYPGWEYKEC